MSNLLSLPAGAILAGDYRIERVLGAGGFGVTYLAHETDVDRYVTIKEYFPTDFAMRGNDLAAVPRSQGSDDYTWGLDRFIDEARTLGKFDHHNIVRLYRYFRENGTAYMVLHFEEGQSLKSWLRALGRAPRQKELDLLVAPLLDALSVIHEADFLHRDIAPDNIIVRNDGTPVLIDFGSARGEIAQHTRTISALVKPGYSPYEQYAETGKKQGPWTDIYAFAGTLYHAVTGKRPPDSPSRIIKDDLQSAEQAAVGAFRPRFLRAIDRGLVLDIDQRPQSIAEWRGDLLAPEEASSGSSWLPRGLISRAEPAEPEVATNDAPTRMITAPIPAAPPPDLPGKEGQFVDFVDQLKGKTPGTEAPGEQAKAKAAASPASPAVAELPPQRTSLRSRLRLGWGGDKVVSSPKAPAAEQSSPPQSEAAAPAVAEALPAPLPRREPPRVLRKARPRPVRNFGPPRWRPLLFKLLIGVGVASGAVALQDKIPKFEFRGTGAVSSSIKPAPAPDKSSSQRSSSRAPQQQASASSNQPARPAPKPLLVSRFQAHSGEISKIRFAKNGHLILTTGTDGALKIWDAESQALMKTLEMDDGPATALAARGNTALTGHSEGVIAQWDLDTGLKQRSFKRNDANIWDLEFAGSSDRFWAGAHDWTVTLWELSTPSAPLQVLEGHRSAVQAVAYSPAAAMLASGGADKRIKLWNGSNLSQIRTYSKTGDFVTALAFSSDGATLAAGTLDGRIRIMSTRKRRYRTLRAHNDAVVALNFDAQDRLISAGKDGQIKQWSAKRRRVLNTFGSANNGLQALDVSPDGSRLISADRNGFVTIWRNPD